jgi:hypothetical protein
LDGGSHLLNATSDRGLPVEFSVANGPATLIDNLLIPQASGPVTVRASQGGNANILAAAPVDQTFTVTHSYPNSRWRQLHFDAAELLDPAVSGDQADPDRDGLVNLIEYAMQSDPKDAEQANPPLSGLMVTVEEQVYQALSYRRRIADVGVALYVEVSDALGDWLHGEPHTVQVGTPVNHGDGTETVVVRSAKPYGASPSEFLRLKAQMNP